MRKIYSAVFILLTLLLSFAPPVFAQQSVTYPVYIVQNGDTLSLIAAKFGISLDDLLAANNLSNSNFLNIGMKLNIPGFPGITGTLEIKTLGVGDTLSLVAKRYHVSDSQLALLNKLTSPFALYAGSELIVPVPENQDKIPPVYRLPDQPLIQTAILNSTSNWSIQLRNHLNDGWDILPGDHISLASDSTPVLMDSSNPINNISISPLPLVQGATEVIHIKTSRPVTLSADLSGHQIGFFQNGDNDYYAFEGIHALDDPGLKLLQITSNENNSNTVLLSQPILLREGSFIQEAVNGVDPNSIDPNVIKQEDDILNSISTTSPTKLWDGPFKFPVDDPCPGSTFGNRRTYNNGAYHYYHTGVDFSVCKANNLNIYAPAPGTIIYTGLLPSKGNYTVIDHGWGVYSCYAHQKEFKVQVGDHVDTGQIIGVIGNTGRTLGPHLHWEVWVNHIPIDPLAWTQQTLPAPENKAQ